MVIQTSPSGGGEGAGRSEQEVAEFQLFKAGMHNPHFAPTKVLVILQRKGGVQLSHT